MSDEHIVKSYDEELQHLNDSLVQMGSLTEKLLHDLYECNNNSR